jgi:hypothetical protein
LRFGSQKIPCGNERKKGNGKDLKQIPFGNDRKKGNGNSATA